MPFWAWIGLHLTMLLWIVSKSKLCSINQEKFCSERRVLPSYVISVVDARQLLRKGCSAYLAHV